jgi:hypothetical protein
MRNLIFVLGHVADVLSSADWASASIIAFFVILSVAGVALIASFIFYECRRANFMRKIERQASAVRVIRYDDQTEKVRYFDLNSMKNVKTVDTDHFFDSFLPSDQQLVKDWIDNLLNGKDTNDFIQAKVYFSHSKATANSFLKAVSVNASRGVVHLESHILKYDKSVRTAKRGFSTESEFSEALKANGSDTGITFCFRLVRLREGGQSSRKRDAESTSVSVRFKDAISPFVTGNQKLIQASENELVIANFDMLETTQGISFALRVKHGAEKALNGKKTGRPPYEIKIGMVSNKDLLGDADAILTEVRRSAAEAADSGSPIVIYKKGQWTFSAEDAQHYRSEVDRIIFEKKLSFTYRPVYCVSKDSVIGYIGRAHPMGTSFASIDELKNYAIRAKDEKGLFASIAKTLIPRFVTESPNKECRLFYPVRMDELKLIKGLFEKYAPAKEANLVFRFNENDVMNAIGPSGSDDFIGRCKEIKDLGYKLALYISGKTLTLDSGVYKMFDYFFIDFSGEGSNLDTKIRSELHALVEKLLKYKKPIIGSNLMDWNSIELVVGSGIDYISSDVFAPYDPMLKPITAKNAEKIRLMAQRQ